MVIPQGVAYAALAGMPLETDIYASLLPALMAVLFSSSVRLLRRFGSLKDLPST